MEKKAEQYRGEKAPRQEKAEIIRLLSESVERHLVVDIYADEFGPEPYIADAPITVPYDEQNDVCWIKPTSEMLSTVDADPQKGVPLAISRIQRIVLKGPIS